MMQRKKLRSWPRKACGSTTANRSEGGTGGGEDARARRCEMPSRGKSEARERERKRLGGDDGGLTGRVIGRSTMEKEDNGMMIYSATGRSETSVRRQERDYEAINIYPAMSIR